MMVDGVPVLKLNNYDLEGGERSVFDQELNRALLALWLACKRTSHGLFMVLPTWCTCGCNLDIISVSVFLASASSRTYALNHAQPLFMLHSS